MNSLNPYQASKVASDGSERSLGRWQTAIVVSLLVFFGTGLLVGIIGTVWSPLRVVLMPRFGWSGLIHCAYPMIFLAMWLRTPNTKIMLSAGLLCLALGAIHAAALLYHGTTDVVENPFSDRLHSAWALYVLPFVLAGVLLLWLRFTDVVGERRAAE